MSVAGSLFLFYIDQYAGQRTLWSVGCAIMPCLLHDICALGYKILSFHLRLYHHRFLFRFLHLIFDYS